MICGARFNQIASPTPAKAMIVISHYITETEMNALVGRNGYLVRRLVGEVVRSADAKRLTESQVPEMLGLESI